MHKFEILPVFPSVISAVQVSEDVSALWEGIENLDFFRSKYIKGYNTEFKSSIYLIGYILL